MAQTMWMHCLGLFLSSLPSLLLLVVVMVALLLLPLGDGGGAGADKC